MATLDIFRMSDDQEMTDALLMQYIRKNDTKVNNRYLPLWKAYNNDYDIFHQTAKAAWKPDNRIAVNFAQFIVDTFEGFFLGIPVKVTADDEAVTAYLNALDDANDSDDINAELSTIVSIFGRGYRIAYVDEEGEIGTAYLDPMESFAVYSESIKPRMRYFIRTYTDTNKKRHGSISDEFTVKYFDINGGEIVYTDEHPHGFDGVPAVEFIQNRARTGLFESVLPLINSYNKVLSEKANDVDYFADAYLKIQGMNIDKETLRFMRENRTINAKGSNAEKAVIEFLQKPSDDDTQEHLLDRIERMIFTVAMVCNISDDNFATSSGIALKYKLLPMTNLAARKWRKFASGLNAYYKLICSNPVTPLSPEDWSTITYTHNLNYPANAYDEAETATRLQNVTSKRTQLSVLSFIDDVDAELEQMAKEASGKDALVNQAEKDTATDTVLNEVKGDTNDNNQDNEGSNLV